MGWCATCVPGAAKGTPSYFGIGEAKDMNEALDISSNSTNWGFCNPHCTQGGVKLLADLRVIILDPRPDSISSDSMYYNANSSSELFLLQVHHQRTLKTNLSFIQTNLKV